MFFSISYPERFVIHHGKTRTILFRVNDNYPEPLTEKEKDQSSENGFECLTLNAVGIDLDENFIIGLAESETFVFLTHQLKPLTTDQLELAVRKGLNISWAITFKMNRIDADPLFGENIFCEKKRNLVIQIVSDDQILVIGKRNGPEIQINLTSEDCQFIRKSKFECYLPDYQSFKQKKLHVDPIPGHPNWYVEQQRNLLIQMNEGGLMNDKTDTGSCIITLTPVVTDYTVIGKWNGRDVVYTLDLEDCQAIRNLGLSCVLPEYLEFLNHDTLIC